MWLKSEGKIQSGKYGICQRLAHNLGFNYIPTHPKSEKNKGSGNPELILSKNYLHKTSNLGLKKFPKLHHYPHMGSWGPLRASFLPRVREF